MGYPVTRIIHTRKKYVRNCWSREHRFKLTCVEWLLVCCHIWRHHSDTARCPAGEALDFRASSHQNVGATQQTLTCFATQSGCWSTKSSFAWCWLCEMLVVASTCLWQLDPSSWSWSCCSTLRLWYDPSLTSFRCAWPLPVSCLEVGDRRQLILQN